MQRLPHDLSLNAVRAFEAVARHGSVKHAAEELAVTPGAVSHQLRQIEASLGCALFVRRNNAIETTEEGREFERAVGPALDAIGRAARRLSRGVDEVTVLASATLAMRWLIPRLELFRGAYPRVHVRLETAVDNRATIDGRADLAIVYTRGDEPDRHAQELMSDLCGLYATPDVIARHEPRGMADLVGMPILSATTDDWDWRLLASRHALDAEALRPAMRLDTDDAAIEAAQAGLGVVMAPEVFVERELRTGVLAALPGTPVEPYGTFWLLMRPGLHRATLAFRDWLLECVAPTVKTR
jgi:LysR family glycine cleavage system transcriptional activator